MVASFIDPRPIVPQRSDRARVARIVAFIDLLARLATLDDAALRDRLPFGAVGSGLTPPEGLRDVDARYALLFRTLEREQEMVVRARTTYHGTEAQRILGLAQVAYGDLRGLIAGVASDRLDRAPREGEWSARKTLEHTIGVERSYRANTAHALRRGPDEPLSLPPDRRPKLDPADAEGDGSRIADRLGARRVETDAELGAIRDDQMTLPSQWSWGPIGVRVDVRFRLHRLASHLVEHTVQCERALEAAGVPFGDARRTVRRISVMRAMHERITVPDELARLDAEHGGRILAPTPA
jgi:hypothetical protein